MTVIEMLRALMKKVGNIEEQVSNVSRGKNSKN